ncbi:MAG: tyrosine-type recombinase/integrase [Alistipes sp.]|uniref:tyrosine-type recombinase/integrase n=1 Tax=Alistipes sp. TaxID=1872444 RepID=UPI003996B03B
MATFVISVREKDKRATDDKYPVAIRITHKRVALYIPTYVYVTRKQIKADFSGLRDSTLIIQLTKIIEKYEEMLLKGLGADLSQYSAQELKNFILAQRQGTDGIGIDFVEFARNYIQALRNDGRAGYAVLFDTTMNSLIDFFGRPVISIKEINIKNLLAFAEFMQKPRTIIRPNQLGGTTQRTLPGVKPQTVKDYLTRIQILFNAACEQYNDPDSEVTLISHNPFNSKKLHIEVTEAPAKRDLGIDDLIKILEAKKLPGQRMQLARDVCALSFYLVAMNTADLFGEDVKLTGRRITYHRQKTARRRRATDEALMSVKIEPEVLPLLRKYNDPDKKRLFCFYKLYGNYLYFNKNVNRGCKQLATYLGIKADLSTYYMRHTLATIASEDCGISDGEVALLLNHVGDGTNLEKGKNLKVTRGYIHRRFTKNDLNHRKILDFIQSKIDESNKSKNK